MDRIDRAEGMMTPIAPPALCHRGEAAEAMQSLKHTPSELPSLDADETMTVENDSSYHQEGVAVVKSPFSRATERGGRTEGREGGHRAQGVI